jgi:hypothetical protein
MLIPINRPESAEEIQHGISVGLGPINDHGERRVKATLTGVSETALLTLNGRAYQANRPDAIIENPMAIKLVNSIDFDFDKFGRKGQEMALRSLAVDKCAIAYLKSHPKSTVVALAEGFQTTFWRLNSALPNAEFHCSTTKATGACPAQQTSKRSRRSWPYESAAARVNGSSAQAISIDNDPSAP